MKIPQEARSETIEPRPSASRKPGVLLVVPWDHESGGVVSVAGHLARYLDSQGHRVLFFHPGVPELLRYKKTTWGFHGVELNLRTAFIPGHRLRSPFAFAVTFPFTLFQLLRLLKAHDIRVVNVHYPLESFVYFAFCRWLMPIRLVVSIHGTDIIFWNPAGKWPSRTLGLLFRAADLVVAPSRAFLRQCASALAPFSASRLVIHNGIDPAELDARESRQATHAPGGFILSIASHDEWKGLDVLIRAMALLRDEGEATRLVLAGDGPLRAELERLAATLKLQQHVQFVGHQPRPSVARLLHECAVFVLPSRSEPFGIVVIEALACGKPVVATTVGGIPEIIQDGANGILVDPEDAHALAAQIRRLLRDPDLRERLGRAGRQRVNDSFQWQHTGERYARAYEELLERRA